MHGCADGRAVVVDDTGRVVGVVSSSDVARALELADLRGFDPYPAHSGADMTSLSSQGSTLSLIRSIRRRAAKGGLRGQNDHDVRRVAVPVTDLVGEA